MMENAETTSNSLGLDFETSAPLEDSSNTVPFDSTSTEIEQEHLESSLPVNSDVKSKKKPYLNPERVKTGGVQREKPSEQELANRMARIKDQNEKIKQRRMDVQADEEAFKKTQEAERIRQVHNREVQEHVDRTREQNARKKMDKVQSREWDSGKSVSYSKERRLPVPVAKVAGDNVTSSTSSSRKGGRPRDAGRDDVSAQHTLTPKSSQKDSIQ
ncbi:hypothetical protein SERLA73DRAFT_185526 [Serpula lacrymans var. lacrymans S7.3]|uniref:Uncharacterized protein n=2 Tax=Serpula lacrymans var. lacrymans TaxID=341189 RepID=F8Q5Z5_SERL3|nr:uncharacterized protein SERLADRAFT_474050 [Serpula lacrymans var. lacrymans S7.9]EGN96033.1 hypothetical protein SERLA73DRAFT_185526 [Serpula lacrymans var. lacrymans S7.3]EGO21557.1 hypothetical protein SERLADRAFT_474050 [Serpula lacrymans var. lacrymans S7.9]